MYSYNCREQNTRIWRVFPCVRNNVATVYLHCKSSLCTVWLLCLLSESVLILISDGRVTPPGREKRRCLLPSTGKNTSPCAGGDRGVPGSDNKWRPVSEDCLAIIWDTVRVLICGEPPRKTGFSWPWTSLHTRTNIQNKWRWGWPITSCNANILDLCLTLL